MRAGDVTACLQDWNRGDPDALDRLLPLIYRELKTLASHSLRRERRDHTLGPTALVHEVFLRLVRQRRAGWQDRTHFLALAATLMRRILVDHARKRQGLKRGGDRQRIPVESLGPLPSPSRACSRVDLLALDRALQTMARIEPTQARLVELRFFGGLTEVETAEVLGVTPRTVRRRWLTARLWLYRHLTEGDSMPGASR